MAFAFAIVPDREDQTGGHPWPHSSIKKAAAPGNRAAVFV
jgi:hypothetical protein